MRLSAYKLKSEELEFAKESGFKKLKSDDPFLYPEFVDTNNLITIRYDYDDLQWCIQDNVLHNDYDYDIDFINTIKRATGLLKDGRTIFCRHINDGSTKIGLLTSIYGSHFYFQCNIENQLRQYQSANIRIP